MGDWALRLRRCSKARSDKVVMTSNSRAPDTVVKSKLDRIFTVLANAPVGSLHRRYRRGESLSPLAITSDIVQVQCEGLSLRETEDGNIQKDDGHKINHVLESYVDFF